MVRTKAAGRKSKGKTKTDEEEVPKRVTRRTRKETTKKKSVSFGDDSDADSAEDTSKLNKENLESETEGLPVISEQCIKEEETAKDLTTDECVTVKTEKLESSQEDEGLGEEEEYSIVGRENIEKQTAASEKTEDVEEDENKEEYSIVGRENIEKETAASGKTEDVEEDENKEEILADPVKLSTNVANEDEVIMESNDEADNSAVFVIDKEGDVNRKKRVHAPEDSVKEYPGKDKKKKKGDRLESEEKRAVFIGNLSYSTKRAVLTKFLESRGLKPTEVIVITDARGRGKGFGYANFETEQEARACSEIKALKLDGRILRLDLTFRRKKGINLTDGDQAKKSQTMLYVSNLAFTVQRDRLKRKFRGCRKVKILTDKVTKKSQGSARIWYNTPEDAKAAIKRMHGVEISGRRILVDFASNIGRKQMAVVDKTPREVPTSETNVKPGNENDKPSKEPKSVKFGGDSESDSE